MRVYTRTGDKGETSIIGGERVSKADLRLDAYGTIDELSAFTGLLYDTIDSRIDVSGKFITEREELLHSLTVLMNVEALVASTKEYWPKMPPVSDEDIDSVEKAIDRMNQKLDDIYKFTLPCGDTLLSLSHVCRTVCRRAERTCVRLSLEQDVPESAVRYLNRLSDYFYTLGRLFAKELNVKEYIWQGRKKE